MDNIIEVNALKKYYGEIKAVDDISFYVEPGKLFAFLGPNGAGKSTTIDMLCTFLRPDFGQVKVGGYYLGKDDNHIRNLIGVVFQDGLLDRFLTVRENIRVRGALYEIKGKALENAIEKATLATGVSDFLDRRYGELSGGQRRRADIARALVNTPAILFLDEPTTGLDPQTRHNVWETIKQLQSDTGMTVFMTTHYMEEAAEADYVIIIDEGKIAAKGTPTRLKEEYSTDYLILWANNAKDIADYLNTLPDISYEIYGKTVRVRIPDTLSALPIANKLREHISGFEVITGTLEDAFLEITGKEIRQ